MDARALPSETDRRESQSVDQLPAQQVADEIPLSRKFGKHIQKRQLDIPEYAASFVDYKALKKLIKKLSATPVLLPQNDAGGASASQTLDPQASLQANKATFFFRLERELEKVNTFYLQKEAELKLRLTTLLDKKRSMQARTSSASKLSSKYIALEEGFRQFSSDLNKLQQFVEINATAFSKILKKWDKTSKSRTKELYLSRAVDVQPIFNRDVISDLSDQATTNLLDFAAWAEGEKMSFSSRSIDQPVSDSQLINEDTELESQFLEAVNSGNIPVLQDWIQRTTNLPDACDRITRAFLSTAKEAPDPSLKLLLDTKLVNLTQVDEINERNILHRAAISGRELLLNVGLSGKVDGTLVDVYGRIPLHYACMHGHVEMIDSLLLANPETINFKDQDNFTPLIHAIVHSRLPCVQKLLSYPIRIDPQGDSDHIPLSLACQYGAVEIVELILQKQPSILPDAEGLYPQHLVARSGNDPQLLLMLRDYGASLDQPDKLYQWTPLFHAASEGHVRCLQFLLESGVDVNVLDEKCLSAMYYATWEGHMECMKLLALSGNQSSPAVSHQPPPQIKSTSPQMFQVPKSTAPAPMSHSMEVDGIPDLSLPPPIIPVRRYGHNFLDTKTFVVVSFENEGPEPVRFYDENKYPAARLTISSKSSDLIPRNLILPIQDEHKLISFQIDNLDAFSIEFDIYPTFGSKIIARTVASSRVFTGRASSSGHWHLELMDPRLRAIGRISFNFQVVKPYPGIPLEITQFVTYWKATSQLESQSSALITGSSLSGDYVRFFVQLTADGVPVLFPQWKVNFHSLLVDINHLTLEQFRNIGAQQEDLSETMATLPKATLDDIPAIHQLLARSFSTLEEALALLPTQIDVDIHVLYPSRQEEEEFRLSPTPNINDFADALLNVVFDHARYLRDSKDGFNRSIVFSSFNQDICTALNWKQPNYPILLCNGLGTDGISSTNPKGPQVQSSGRTTSSVKSAVQIARDNNFMGLICNSRLLALAPALIESIKTAGLVLITDLSDTADDAGSSYRAPEGVDGFLRRNGVLRFNETIDM
ncbi:putative cyclin dependent kinase inhibitor Pho81 [Patellaria atrata CBS 101060]|uniref:Cyclin dependent kinase inhibitor Pho81 n=1 Tax=Patellaria atrata CBS 101060 TaxID=1346257 RepID=A0A9P4SF87_9PEZI|nr:putative cyclin dependent kinase inhibitor Pho81 [Patellaria atrata CBS 101060]